MAAGVPLVAVVFVVGALVVLGLAGAVLPLGPAKGLLKLIATCLMGVAMSVYGLVMVWKVAQAPRLTVGGVVHGVEVFRGKGAHTNFELDGPDGPVALHLAGSGMGVTEGDQAIVHYVGGLGTVTHVEMLSGVNSGKTVDADDGHIGAWMLFGVGMVLVVIAFWNHARYPDGASRRGWF